MANKTLHGAIKAVLLEADKSLPAVEIADSINQKLLYQRKDGKKVPVSQVTARAKNYEDLFFVKEGIISLKENRENPELEIIKKYFKNEINNGKPLEKLELLRGFLKYQEDKFKNKKEKENSNGDNIQVEGPHETYFTQSSEIHFKEKNEFLKEVSLAEDVFSWAFKNERDSFPAIPEEIGRVIAGLKLYNKQNRIYLYSNLIWNYVIPIVQKNSNQEFHIEKLDAYENKSLTPLNLDIRTFLRADRKNVSSKQEFQSIGILTHRGFQKDNDGLPGEFSYFSQLAKPEKLDLDQLILIIPEFSLRKTDSNYVNVRKRLISDQRLTTVISLPKYRNKSIHYSLLLFNFTYPSKDIFFADFSRHNSFNSEEIQDVINNRKSQKDISRSMAYGDLDYSSYDLLPKRYVVDPNDFVVESGKRITTLKSLLKNYKAGFKNIQVDNLYAGGEIKYLRPSDLNSNFSNFFNTDKIVGVDHDELNLSDNLLISGGLTVSRVGNNIKPTILPEDEFFVLDPHLSWLEPDSKKVPLNYLLKELKKDYVKRQVEYFSYGFRLPRIKNRDLLHLKIQVPENNDFSGRILVEGAAEQHLLYEMQVEELRREKDNFIKILKHTLKQRIGSLSGDFKTLSTFLEEKIKSNSKISIEELTVPVFPEDKPDDVEAFKLGKLLSRMNNALSMSHDILEKAEKILKLRNLEKEEINLKEIIRSIAKDKPHINFEIKGAEASVLADRSLITIMFDNFFENAEKHGGLKKMKNRGRIGVEVTNQAENIVVEIRNNGESMESDFTIEDFLSNGISNGESTGSGFGGYLIGQILSKHKGKVEIIDPEELTMYNVGFRIYLPKI